MSTASWPGLNVDRTLRYTVRNAPRGQVLHAVAYRRLLAPSGRIDIWETSTNRLWETSTNRRGEHIEDGTRSREGYHAETP
jgi:hypothetical protein